MSNNKERYFVFAHTGAGFVLDHCNEMKIEKAFGTTLPNGIHVTHFQMCKNNGKRASAANKVIDQYNALVGEGSKQLVAASFPGCDSGGVVCLKRDSLVSHPMIVKIACDIEMDVAAAWSWPIGAELLSGGRKEKPEPEIKKAKAVDGSMVPVKVDGVRDFVMYLLRKLGCGMSVFDKTKISCVVDDISSQFQKQFGSSVKNIEEHRDFIEGRVRKMFSSELDIVCVPYSKSLGAGAIMSDIVGEGQSDPLKFPPDKVFSADQVNSETTGFFRTYLQLHSGADPAITDLAARDFINALNKGSFGTYRFTSVESFLSPLIGAKVLTPRGTKRPYRLFSVDHAKVAAFLLF
jgi:hypothetical protein